MSEARDLLTLEGLERLQAPEGQALLEEAAAYAEPLEAVTALRKRYPADLVGMAVEQATLRRRAAVRFADASRMFFLREALEQASGEVVASHRARRYADYEQVADWGCGIGGDALALAAVTRVLGLDTDPLRVAVARANARVLGHGNAEFLVADYLERPPDAPAVWADPARRRAGRRVTDPAAYLPPLDRILAHAAGLPLGVKVSPAVDAASIPADAEAEFISVNGELKEAVLWFGDLRTVRRRATVLPEGISLVPEAKGPLPVAPPGAVLYDPDPAVVRAGAVADLGRILDAWQIDPAIAYLSGEALVPTPFAQALRVEAAMPWNGKALKRHLRAHGLRVEEVRKRGSAVDADTLRRSLRTDGDTPIILVLTRHEDRPFAIIAQRVSG